MSVPSAATFQQRYLETGDIADLDAAISHSRADLSACEAESPARSGHLSRLSNALRMRFDHLGDDRDLDEAIEVGRECADATPPGHRFKAQRLSNLGFALRLRYERLGQPADIEQATHFGARAVEAAADDAPALPLLQSNLAVASRVRYEVSADPADLARAIEMGTRCLRATDADAYERRGMLSNLGLAHFETFEISRARSDLAAGATLLSQALDATPQDDPDWPMYALNLSMTMRVVAAEVGSADAADRAVDLAERAYHRLPGEHRERPGALSELGRAHWIRSVTTGDATAAALAIGYRRAAANDPVASPILRTLAAVDWAQWSRETGDLPEAVTGYRAVVELLAVVAWHGLDVTAQQRHLRRWREPARAAAATCVEAGLVPWAIELLEQGRTVLWNQVLDRRADFGELRTQQPELAERLERIRVVLDADRRHLSGSGDVGPR